MDMDISMDIHRKSVDMNMDMDGKFHIGGKPGHVPSNIWAGGQHTGCPSIICPKTIKFLISTMHLKSDQGDVSAPTTGQFFLITSLAHYL